MWIWFGILFIKKEGNLLQKVKNHCAIVLQVLQVTPEWFINRFNLFRPILEWYYLVAIGILNALGYIIFRASETQRCEFAKDPNSPAMKSKYNEKDKLSNFEKPSY